MQLLFETLGLEPSATFADIKAAYRCLAKKYHPDKNRSAEATALFQQLNYAYNILTDIGTIQKNDYVPNQQSDNKLCYISLSTKENTFSVTIDIVDVMFLVFIEECKAYHGVSPTDRGQHGLQLYFAYTSPDDSETYGSISLTFYPTTARLLVQGSSYLLWVDEHMPVIYARAEHNFMENASRCNGITKRLGIGLKRDSRPTMSRRMTRASTRAMSSLDATVSTVPESPISDATVSTVAVSSLSDTTVSTVPESSISDATVSTVAVSSLSDPTVSTVPVSSISDATVSTAPVSSISDPTVSTVPVSSISDATVSTVPVSSISDPTVSTVPVSSISDATVSTVPVSSLSDDTASTVPVSSTVSTHGGTGNSKASKKKHQKGNQKKSKTKPRPKKVFNSIDADVKYCKDTCDIPALISEPMIRCTLCMTWHHILCTGEDSDYVGAWTCDICRTLPFQVKSLSEKINDLTTSLSNLPKTDRSLKEEISKLMSENNNLRQKLQFSNQRNSELQKLINTMCFQDTSSVPGTTEVEVNQPEQEMAWVTVPTQNRFDALSNVSYVTGTGMGTPSSIQAKSPRRRQRRGHAAMPSAATGPQHTASEHLVTSSRRPDINGTTVTIIGSSIVRGVAPMVHGRGFHATGYVYPGHTARQINGHIKDIPADSDITVIAAGTNNVEQHSVRECVTEIRQVIDNGARKRRDKHVIMSTLPYRYDRPDLNTKIDEINAFIADEVKTRNKWHLLRHDLSQRDYKRDGLHFNVSGVAKYAHEIRRIIRRFKSR